MTENTPPQPPVGRRFNEWLKTSITLKFFVIGILILILLIPSAMVMSLIRERQSTMRDVVEEVNSKWGYSQTVTGPVISVPYIDAYKNQHYLHILPDKLDCEGTMTPDVRYRSIYEVVVYNADLNFTGHFSTPDCDDLGIQECDLQWDEAFISIGIPDMRGIQENIKLDWDGKEYAFDPGVETNDVIQSGVSVEVPFTADSLKRQYPFSFAIHLNGSEDLSFVPFGKETNVKLTSSWANPSFDGSFLPDQREVTDSGFTASWKVLHLNRNYPQQWRDDLFKTRDSAFGVKLLIPVDQYQKTMRSAKYAELVIVLSFLVFLFVEILNKKRIHPIQYLLIGFGLILFYTLLVSLSEHIGFDLAYLLSSILIVGLVASYAQSIFKQTRLTLLTTGVLGLLYGFIYTLLQLQDYSLLLGSIGLFIALALIMNLSRKINWYGGPAADVEEQEQLT